MQPTTWLGLRPIAAALVCLALAGCTGRGDLMVLDLAAEPIPVQAVTDDPAPLRVAVWPPEARTRPQFWSREHLWGGYTYYTVPGTNLPAAVAMAMVKRFREHGWQAWLEAPHPQESRSPADVTISGELDELSAKATSSIGRTHIKVVFRMTVTASNAADGGSLRMRLRGHGTDWVFWFEPSDVQKLVRSIVEESLDKFLAQTTVEKRALRTRAAAPTP